MPTTAGAGPLNFGQLLRSNCKIYTMQRTILCFLIAIAGFSLKAQELYFPPANGGEWDTLSPATLNWCPEKVDALYDFLEAEETFAFLVLKNGRIVLEKYFGETTAESSWLWFSAGKSLRAVLVGVAQQEGLLDIQDPTADYLGAGWTSLPPEQEDSITIWHQLTMTTGLDEAEFSCVAPGCLTYVADAGTRWAYHNGPYNLLKAVLEAATGLNHNTYTFNRIRQPIGMQSGLWVGAGNNDFFTSRARDMARFGLLVQNRGVWDGQAVLSDTAYWRAMLQPSQPMNPSYGYLWWLNGQPQHILPDSPEPISGSIAPAAPPDLYLAAGGLGQFISIAPSEGLMVIRQGNSNNTSLAALNLHNEVWARLSNMECVTTSQEQSWEQPTVFPNPARGELYIRYKPGAFRARLFDAQGREVDGWADQPTHPVAHLPVGVYWLRIATGRAVHWEQVIIAR